MMFTSSQSGSHGPTSAVSTAADRQCSPAPGAEPVVTVVIPTYNRAHLITRALRSVLAQTFTDFEIIVVDDGSTDDTETVVISLDDARVHYYRQPNAGASAARNYGMREAKGEFIAFLDSDDEWFPNKLELQVARFRELPNTVGMLYTGSQTVTEGSPPETFIPSQRGNLYRQLLEQNVAHGTSSVMIRRSVVERVGYFDEQFPAIEDYDYWVRVSTCFEIDFVPAPLMRYHDAATPDRLSRGVSKNLQARELFYLKHRTEMERFGVAHLFLQESAQRHLKRSHWDPTQGRKLVRAAIRTEPRALRLYALFAKSLIPTPIFRMLVKMTEAAKSG